MLNNMKKTVEKIYKEKYFYTFQTISYAGDPQILKTFYDIYGNCMNELNVQREY